MARNPIIKEILRQGRGRSRRHIKAALEIGRVESNFTNPSGGDADSAGWRQERRSLYKNPTNVKASVRRVYKELAELDHGQKSYELAADVQRPAQQYRGRYKGASHEAQGLLSGRKTRGTSKRDSSLHSSVSVRESSKTSPTFDQGGYQDALRRRSLALLFSRHPGGSVLTRTGVLSTAPVDPSEFKGSKTVRSRRVFGSQDEPSQAGRTPSRGSGSHRAPSGLPRGKVIGTPYAGTHTLGNWQSDNAIDVSLKPGTPVRSVTDGVVVKVSGNAKDTGRFGGIAVTIKGKHGGTFYTHLRSSKVRPGQRIRRGDILGGSGTANGVAHLHFGVEHGDPRRYEK